MSRRRRARRVAFPSRHGQATERFRAEARRSVSRRRRGRNRDACIRRGSEPAASGGRACSNQPHRRGDVADCGAAHRRIGRGSRAGAGSIALRCALSGLRSRRPSSRASSLHRACRSTASYFDDERVLRDQPAPGRLRSRDPHTDRNGIGRGAHLSWRAVGVVPAQALHRLLLSRRARCCSACGTCCPPWNGSRANPPEQGDHSAAHKLECRRGHGGGDDRGRRRILAASAAQRERARAGDRARRDQLERVHRGPAGSAVGPTDSLAPSPGEQALLVERVQQPECGQDQYRGEHEHDQYRCERSGRRRGLRRPSTTPAACTAIARRPSAITTAATAPIENSRAHVVEFAQQHERATRPRRRPR